MEVESIFKVDLNKWGLNLKTLLISVMLFIALVPLIVHIFSIENYSDFIIENDRKNKQDILRSLIINSSTSVQEDNAILISDMIANDEDFTSALLSTDKNLINNYFKNIIEETFIVKNTIDVKALVVFDTQNNMTASFGELNFAPGVIKAVLDDQTTLADDLRNLPRSTYRPDLNIEPKFITVYPLKETDYQSTLVVVSSVWDVLIGSSLFLQADVEVRGQNDELFFKEELVTSAQGEDLKTLDISNIEPLEIILPYDDEEHFVRVLAYASDVGILAKSDDLKSITIIVAIICIFIVWIIGAYFLKTNLFNRIEYFSKAMKNIVDGNEVDEVSTYRNDEFATLEKELRRVIEHNIERTRIKEDLEKAIKQAEVANSAKSDFLANMSHELRTPLNAIIGFSEILANEKLDKFSRDKTHEYAVDIRDSGKHLLSIINDILDLSKVEAGKMRFYEDEVDLIEICETSIRVLSNHAKTKDIVISLNAREDLPFVMADERMMQQIITNLLSNAVKFSLALGEIKIDINESAMGDIIINVTDNGIGIARDKIEDVLEPFNQIETSYDKTEVGTGLGLSLVKAFIEMHDGEIKIESEFGKYTTVSIKIPYNRVIIPKDNCVELPVNFKDTKAV